MDLLVQARTYWKKASGKWPVLDWSICITHIMAQREAFDEAENEFETSHKKAGWNEECKSSPYHSASFVACCLFWQRQLGFNKKTTIPRSEFRMAPNGAIDAIDSEKGH